MVGMEGMPCIDNVFWARDIPFPVPILSAVAILWRGKFCLESITLPMPDKARILEDEAELCRYLELEDGGGGGWSNWLVPRRLVRLPYTPTLLSNPIPVL